MAGFFGLATRSSAISASETSNSESSSSSTPSPVGRGDVEHDRLTAPLLGHQLLLGELLAHAGRVGVLAVGLGDRDDDRHLGRARVRDRLDRLRHHTVVGRDHEDRDVGDLRAARTHRGERLVAGRVDERDAAIAAVDLVRTDRLRDAAGLTRDDVRVAGCVSSSVVLPWST